MALLTASSEVRAQCELREHLASDGDLGHRFGTSIAAHECVVAVGASLYSGNDWYTGGVYLYKRTDGKWIEQSILTASDGQTMELFGKSVAINGQFVAVGASAVDGRQGQNHGAVYVYQFDGSTWAETKIMASDGDPGDQFGGSVALAGEVLVAGAPRDGDLGHWSGSVYVYRFDGEQWDLEEKLLASDGGETDQLGISIATDADVIVAGAVGDAENGQYAGAAYVFRYAPETAEWVEEAKLLSADGQLFDFFGLDVAIEDDRIIVGAAQSFNGLPGAAYVFERSGTMWVERDKITASDGRTGDEFGSSVSINGDLVVVGARGTDAIGVDSGAGYVYRLDHDLSQWTEIAVLSASDGSSEDLFGASVVTQDNWVAFGAPLDDDGGTDSGSVYEFELDGADCNRNGICDTEDINAASSSDANGNEIPDECDVDYDGDGLVGIVDVLWLLAAWGGCEECTDCPLDFDGDCEVGYTEFLVVLGHWGR